ncbi:hypothetical protein RHGRI_013899 [Rhododendron griersonianum]|uniref:Uncharacterized protein n=1 Tax=Rhododendron griersonianum TaxID=479676 RepID=A0AAV6K7R5_9ERIC|nr:hypothetical protein RHGRI_013899 [Rhododendron griersonianum]
MGSAPPCGTPTTSWSPWKGSCVNLVRWHVAVSQWSLSLGTWEQNCQDLTNNMLLDLGGMSLCHALRAKESPNTPLTCPSLLHPQCLIPCAVSSDKLILHWTSSPSMPRLGVGLTHLVPYY